MQYAKLRNSKEFALWLTSSEWQWRATRINSIICCYLVRAGFSTCAYNLKNHFCAQANLFCVLNSRFPRFYSAYCLFFSSLSFSLGLLFFGRKIYDTNYVTYNPLPRKCRKYVFLLHSSFVPKIPIKRTAVTKAQKGMYSNTTHICTIATQEMNLKTDKMCRVQCA